jgi:feruloyl esterase
VAFSTLGRAASVGGGPGDGASWAKRCAAVQQARGLPNASTITSAVLNPPAAEQPAPNAFTPATPALPEHCEVVGKMNERIGANGQSYAIHFRLRLPTAWNRRFFFQGGGGTNGALGNAVGPLQGQQPTVALALGYAVVSQDSGHDNVTNDDPSRSGTATFGFDPQARADFGYRSYEQVAQISQALIRQYYSRPPEKSYYVGCSEGGREGMMVSQRFPGAFDGVLACAPGFRLPRAAVAEAWDSQAFAGAAREAGLVDAGNQVLVNKTLTDDDLVLVSNAVLAACDGLDGLTDGTIQSFTACTTALVHPMLVAATCTGPKTDSCLSAAQVRALEKVFDGARTSNGEMLYAPWVWDAGIGGKVGSAYQQGWRMWKLGPYDAPAYSALNLTLGARSLAAVFATPPVPVASTGASPASYSLSFDIDSAPAALSATTETYRESALEFMKADSTDLSGFKRRGGKLIIVHGVSDPVFSIQDTVNWWNELNALNGGRASQFVRLFAVPGMTHCAGGPSTDQFNAFAALVDWVEKGRAPERIIATARKGTPWPGRTRPLCAYPKLARYAGTGSIEAAESFVCR